MDIKCPSTASSILAKNYIFRSLFLCMFYINWDHALYVGFLGQYSLICKIKFVGVWLLGFSKGLDEMRQEGARLRAWHTVSVHLYQCCSWGCGYFVCVRWEFFWDPSLSNFQISHTVLLTIVISGYFLLLVFHTWLYEYFLKLFTVVQRHDISRI